jgi:hypothetical protein
MPMLPFDPIELRDFWLEVRLKYALDDEPRGPGPNRPSNVVHISRTNHSVGRVCDFVDGYLVGLSRELKPAVEKHLAWMESEPEPDRVIYMENGLTYEGWLDSLYDWRQALGLCKWLGRGDRAFADLTSAAVADWQVIELASPALAFQARASRRNFMDIHLAGALAADAPLIGLKIYEAAGMKAPMEPPPSPVPFGHWACRHLVERGTRDETFVSRGRDMLTANLLPRFYEGGRMYQVGLWLKAIYFDSGVVQTPEQAFAKAYDSMPGVPRPDFMPA